MRLVDCLFLEDHGLGVGAELTADLADVLHHLNPVTPDIVVTFSVARIFALSAMVTF